MTPSQHIIAANNVFHCVYIAHWKRAVFRKYLAAAGNPRIYFYRTEGKALVGAQEKGGIIIAWSSKISQDLRAQCEEQNTSLVLVEDGFIRSRGLGVRLIPPLSLCFDTTGIYYDATRASDVENMIQNFDADKPAQKEILHRAARIIEMIRTHNITKYNLAIAEFESEHIAMARARGREIILAVGQVESDASIKHNASSIKTNAALLRTIRDSYKKAYIIYKPHPDTVAGLRTRDAEAERIREIADEVVTDASITALFDVCDNVHVNTSLAGLEALIRGKKVYCYGVPFYAGWGVTQDYVQCARRTQKRDLKTLIACAYVCYPHYLNPQNFMLSDVETLIASLGQAGGNTATLPLQWFYNCCARFSRLWRIAKKMSKD